jgi:hypothetical protein
MKLVLVLFGSFIFLLVLYTLYLLFAGWSEAASAPREDMYFCNKHGFIKQKHMIVFPDKMDVGTGTVGPDGREVIERQEVRYCPVCFHGNMSAAEKAGR